jgi:hypothetical protein
MEHYDIPEEFGRWLGAHEGEPFMIIVQPVEGSGAVVTTVSDPEQVAAAYDAYMDVFTTQAAKRLLEMEDREAEEDED